MSRLPRSLLLGAASAVLTLTVAAPAAPGRERGGVDRGWRSHSFDGSCSLEGTVSFDPGATFVQQVLNVDSHLDGTCTGLLDGADVSDVPVRMHNTVQSSGSCLHAETLSPGPGTLTFVDGATIHYTFEFNWLGTDGMTRYQGNRSGSAVAHGTFRNPGLSGEGSKCASSGVTETGIIINLATQSPLVSRCKSHRDEPRCR